MRVRAGIVLIQDGRVALIERHRAGMDYFVFLVGGVDEWKVFSRSIREGGEPPIPYEQLIGETKATFAVVESLRKQETMKIP